MIVIINWQETVNHAVAADVWGPMQGGPGRRGLRRLVQWAYDRQGRRPLPAGSRHQPAEVQQAQSRWETLLFIFVPINEPVWALTIVCDNYSF